MTEPRGKILVVDDEPEMRDILGRVLQTGDNYANEMRLSPTEVHADERFVDCRVAPIELEGAALVIEITDVTRRNKISRENALLIQHGAGRQMIRQLAHEIKNPLGGIRGAAQLLGKQLADEELCEYTDVVISETDRLAGLVDQLLGPGGPPNKQPANVHELIEYVVRLIEAEGADHVKFERDYDPGLPLIDLDRDQIVQALMNLVRNAVAALEGLGKIRLRSRAVTNFTIGDTRHKVIASIEIEDDGKGLGGRGADSYGMEIMREIGIHPSVIRAGMANMFLSPVFRDTLAEISGATIELYDTDGSVGAARVKRDLRVGVVVQTRAASSRLRRKAFLELAGATVTLAEFN